MTDAMPPDAMLTHAHNIIRKHLRQQDPSAPGPEAIAEWLQTQQRTYWPTGNRFEQILGARYPDRQKQIRMAAAAVEGFIMFWQPWHMEKTHTFEKLTWPIRWSFSPNGDNEWPHALARFSHMVDLAVAAHATGNRKFVDAYIKYLSDFYPQRFNPRIRLWRNCLDAAIRLVNLIRSYDILRRQEKTFSLPSELVYALVITDAELVANNLGQRVTNWEFFMTTALLTSVTYLEEFFATDEWQTLGQRRLAEILTTEIGADGNTSEQVPMYHGQCLLVLLDFVVILKANGLAVGQMLVEKIVAMLGCLRKISDPNGFIIPIGDSDVFDVSYIAGYARAVLEGKERGGDANISPNACDLPSGSRPVMEILRPTNWAVIRWFDADSKAWLLLFDASGKPLLGRDGHSHADHLQLLLYDAAGPVFADPGRFTYARHFGKTLQIAGRPIDPYGRLGFVYKFLNRKFGKINVTNWRDYFRSALCHNTIAIGEKEAWINNPDFIQPQSALRRASSGGPLFWLHGQNSCTVTHPSGHSSINFDHNRIIAGFLPHIVVAWDKIISPKPQRWIISFHFGSRCLVEKANGVIRIGTGTGAQIQMQFFELKQNAIQFTIEDGWMAPEYNRKQLSRVIRIRTPVLDSLDLLSIAVLTAPSKTGSAFRPAEVTVDQLDAEVIRISATEVNTQTLLYLNPQERPYSDDFAKTSDLLRGVRREITPGSQEPTVVFLAH